MIPNIGPAQVKEAAQKQLQPEQHQRHFATAVTAERTDSITNRDNQSPRAHRYLACPAAEAWLERRRGRKSWRKKSARKRRRTSSGRFWKPSIATRGPGARPAACQSKGIVYCNRSRFLFALRQAIIADRCVPLPKDFHTVAGRERRTIASIYLHCEHGAPTRYEVCSGENISRS